MRGLRTSRAFSLIEMTIVITIIGLVGAIAAGRLSHFAYQAKVSASAASVLNMAMKIDEIHAIEGDYPSEIKPEWFVGRKLPANPFAPDPAEVIRISAGDQAGKFHPSAKIYLPDGTEADSAYWYNPANGAIRARVADRGPAASTLMLYNVVNGANAVFLSQTDQNDQNSLAIAPTSSHGASEAYNVPD
ncbi:MAG: type II secretion system protein [Planctomycetota bacterium]